MAARRAGLQDAAGQRRDRQAGHNPAGGWMVLLLLALLFGETLSGLYVANDVADQGPLTELIPARIANTITALHWIFWDALLTAVALHLLAILAYGERTKPLQADDHRLEVAASRRAGAAHGQSLARELFPRR